MFLEMVIEHLGPQNSNDQKLKFAPVSDRVLASVVDLALFWPVFSLVLSGLVRQMQYRYYASPDSLEFLALLVVLIVCYLGLSILVQAMCWSIIGATPGQLFFQIRILRTKDHKHLTLYSALLRAGLFWFEFLTFGVAWLEVFSHPERRTFHDRASESGVYTLKVIGGADAPSMMEQRLVKNLLTVVLSFCLLLVFAQTTSLYKRAVKGKFKESELVEQEALCADVSARDPVQRLDTALALFESDELDAECLQAEIDFAFWKQDSGEQSWASLAEAILSKHDQKMKDEYLKQTCEQDQGMACQISKWIESKEKPLTAIAKDSQAWFVLAANEYLKEGRHVDLADLMRNPPEEFDLKNYLEVRRLEAMIQSDKRIEAQGGYELIYDLISSDQQKQISQFFCSEQLIRKCTNHQNRYCEDFEKILMTGDTKSVQDRDLILLAEYKSCHLDSGLSVLELAKDVDPKSWLGKMILALVPNSKWSREKREMVFREIAFDKDRTSWVRARALTKLLETSTRFEDFEKGQELLTMSEVPFRSGLGEIYSVALERTGFLVRDKNQRMPASLEAQ